MEHMIKQYVLTNNKDDESFIKSFCSIGDAKHWITNHLDLSKEWNVTPKQNTIEDFIKENKISIHCEYSDSNPNMERQDMNHYKVTLKRKYKLKGNHLDSRYGHKQMTLFFSQGYGIDGEPKASNVLNCLKSDYQVSIDGFDDFCANCGYDNDSIKAKKIYDSCVNQGIKLKKFLSFGEPLKIKNDLTIFNNLFNKLLDCESL